MARNIVVTLECFVKKGDKFLLLRRHPDKKILPGVWMAPGGHREFNEGLFECSRREVKEETGLDIKNIRIKVAGNAYLKDLGKEFFFHLLVADCSGGVLHENTPDGKLEWLTLEQILSLDNLLAELKYVMPHIASESDRVISYKAVYEKGNEMISFEMENP